MLRTQLFVATYKTFVLSKFFLPKSIQIKIWCLKKTVISRNGNSQLTVIMSLSTTIFVFPVSLSPSVMDTCPSLQRLCKNSLSDSKFVGPQAFYLNTGKSKSEVYFLLAQDKRSVLWPSTLAYTRRLGEEKDTRGLADVQLEEKWAFITQPASRAPSCCVCACVCVCVGKVSTSNERKKIIPYSLAFTQEESLVWLKRCCSLSHVPWIWSWHICVSWDGPTSKCWIVSNKT